MKQLYIDFDGVILDTMTRSYEELKKENIDTYKLLSSFDKLRWSLTTKEE